MRLFITYILLSLICSGVYAQKVSPDYSSYITASDNVVSQYLANETRGHKYILFAMEADSYWVIVDKGKFYDEFYINKITNSVINKSHKIKKKEKEMFDKVFDKNTYHIGLLDFSNFNITSEIGRPIYFYFCDSDSNKYGEFLLPFFTNPTPVNQDVYYFLLKKMLSNINKYH